MSLTSRSLIVLGLALAILPACASSDTSEEETAMAEEQGAEQSEDQKTLYALGLAVSQNLVPLGLTTEELEVVQKGLADGVLEREGDVSLEEYGPKIQQWVQGRMQAAAGREKEASMAFLETKGAEEGFTKTESGLLYKETTAGTGASPSETDVVKVHYEGTLRDGSVFDSSIERDQPATFSLNQVIPCWTEGLQRMKVGGKATLVCPSDLAYGERGSPPKIMPGSALQFKVELLEIVEAPAPG